MIFSKVRRKSGSVCGLGAAGFLFVVAPGFVRATFMIRLFRHYVPPSLLALGVLEGVWLLIAADLGWRIRLVQAGLTLGPVSTRWIELLTFAFIVHIVLFAVGYYRSECFRSLRVSVVRMIAALFLSALALPVVFFFLPHVVIWRSVLAYALVMSALGLIMLRGIFQRLGGVDRFKRKVLVLGAGTRARVIADLSQKPGASFEVVAWLKMTEGERMITSAIDRTSIASLTDFVGHLGVGEVVLAADERRGTLPIASLIDVKLAGTPIFEFTHFIERETGRVEIHTLDPSWIIFGEGFRASHHIAVVAKRFFDLIASSVLLVLTAPILLLAAVLVALTSRGPILYKQERVGLNGQVFNVFKFRSMHANAEACGTPQWAQKSDQRITPIGRFLRATRIDEIPQIFNVFKGDMSFVGPRPERPYFVNELSRQIPFFAERHVVKPGITGWAQINYPYGASINDARAKLEYDLYYVKNYSVFLDLLILIQTVRVILWQDGVR